MNIQRTSPKNHLAIRASGSEGGSTSNLSNLDEEEQRVTKYQRKRKERGTEYDLRKEFAEFRTFMIDLIRETSQAQNANINAIHKDILDIKEEVKTIKLTTENLTAEYKKLNEVVENITVEQQATQEKIAVIEKDLDLIKSYQNEKQPSTNQHNLIQELQDRFQREKNIIMVGLEESKDENPLVRNNYDSEKVDKILYAAYQDCPKPLKTLRLGKENSEKPRPIKIIFQSAETAKSLLKNKSKISEQFKIFSDQTPSQRTYMTSLVADLKRREGNGETHLVIKYVKGVPAIIKTNTAKMNTQK